MGSSPPLGQLNLKLFFLGFRVGNHDQKDLFALGLKSIGSKLEEQHDLEDSGFSIFTVPKK